MIALSFPKGGKWEGEEVQNQKVVRTESQMHTFQLHGIEDSENGHLFCNEEKCSLSFPVELWA